MKETIRHILSLLYLDGVQGTQHVQRSKPYMQYDERAAQPATPQSAKSTSRTTGCANRQAGAVQKAQGQILVSLLIVVPSMVLIVAAYLNLSASSYRSSRQDQFHTMAQIAADSGADYAIGQLNQNGNYATTSETTLHSDAQVRTTYSETVTTSSDSNKTITSIGKTYWPANSLTPATSVTIKVDLRAVQQGNYSVIGGEGGLIMSNTSKIVAGDIFINGTISLSNSAQIGLSTNAVNVDVADQACPVPPDATYPRICNANEAAQPITINNTAHIYGTVKANNQTTGTAMTNPGLVASSGVNPQALPTYDRASQKAAVTTTITGAAASCSSGTETWAANTKITGDVTISNSCKVTVAGNIWITGELRLSNTTQMIVADSLGTTRPNIMVDGEDGAIFKNSAKLVSNASGTGFEIYSFWANASCSPDCTTLSGADLYNSRSSVTISLDNSAQGPQSIFYAYWSKVLVRNSGQLGALVGQTIELQNSGTITFGSTTSTGSTFWVANGYRRSF